VIPVSHLDFDLGRGIKNCRPAGTELIVGWIRRWDIKEKRGQQQSRVGVGLVEKLKHSKVELGYSVRKRNIEIDGYRCGLNVSA
jgi:hypothetical protein